MMLARLFSLDFRRRRLLARAPDGPLRDFLATPFANGKQPCTDTRYLALDLETTGGDPAQHEIVSLGWVCLDGARIDLASARHHVVRLAGAMTGNSAVIHAITDDEAAAGITLEEALQELLRALAGRVLIAHHAKTELGFIGRACERHFGGRILIPAVDTLDIAVRRLNRQRETPAPGSLRLGTLRRQYNLPRYPAHNALSDALSAAELFLAQLAQCPAPPALKDWLFRQ
jgi:DNA polymerase-3 subunit epsilon